MARRAVVLSVPSRADDNPEHIHLFDRDQLERLFGRAGARSVRFEYVLNHLIAVATGIVLYEALRQLHGW